MPKAPCSINTSTSTIESWVYLATAHAAFVDEAVYAPKAEATSWGGCHNNVVLLWDGSTDTERRVEFIEKASHKRCIVQADACDDGY